MAQSQQGIGWTAQLQVFGGWKGVQKAGAMFLAGFGVVVVTGLTRTVWDWIREAWRVTRSSFMTRMEINSRDEAYVWLMEWLQEQGFAQECRSISVTSTWEESTEDGDSKAVILYTPDVGRYSMTYRGVRVWITRSRDEGNVSDQLARFGGVFETLTLTCWGNTRNLLKQLMDEAKERYNHKDEGKTIIFTASNGSWQRFGLPRPVRPLASVILPKGLSEKLVADAHEFLKSSSWYAERGIPYRRGYLLHGPPGTGKTSFVTALAGHLGMSICVVNLNNPELSDEELVYLLNKTPGKRCILLIEDIDAAPSSLSREAHQSSELSSQANYSSRTTSKISLSGLLNALDGVASQEGRILFMTTNHFELLDPALSRPGRIDVKVLLPHADKEQIARLFVNFYPGKHLLASQFADALPNDLPISSSHIQAHFMLFKFDAEAALAHVQDLVASAKNSPTAP